MIGQHYILISINNMLQSPSLDKPSNRQLSESKNNKTNIFRQLVNQAIKQKNLLLIQQTNYSATLKQPNFSPIQKSKQRLLKLSNKQNSIEIRCLQEMISYQSKSLKFFLLSSIQKLNSDKRAQVFGIKAFYDSSLNVLNIQSHITKSLLDNVQKNQIIFQFLRIVCQMFQISLELEQSLVDYSAQIQIRLKSDLIKYRQVFEENRMRRQNATKICLLSKNKSNLLNKIVTDYMEEIRSGSQLTRQLNVNYRNKKKCTENNVLNRNVIRMWQKRQTEESKKSNLVDKKKVIVQPIDMVNQEKQRELDPGGFGQVTQYRCSFKQLYTFYFEAQQHIEKHLQNQNLEKQQKLISEILVKKKPLNQSQHSLFSFKNQLICLNFLRHLRCPQIAQYYNPVVQVKQQRNFDQEFLQSQYIYSKYYEVDFYHQQKRSHKTKLKILQDLAEGIKFLVDFGLLHRDLKPSNIKLTKQRKVKIIDFGSACLEYGREMPNSKANNRRVRNCFSPEYTLDFPKARLNQFSEEEYYRHKFYDLYAYGVIIKKYISANHDDPDYLIESIEYLSGKCTELNPEDRLEPIQILLYLRQLSKLISLS